MQSHLLLRALVFAYGDVEGADAAEAIVPKVLTGLGGLTSQRLCAAMGVPRDSGDASAIAKVLQIHPTFHPRRYVDLRVELLDDRGVRFALGPSPIFDEGDGATWLAALDRDPGRGRPRARVDRAGCRPAGPVRARGGAGDERFAYEAVVDPGAEPAIEAPEVSLAKISTGATFQFIQRRPVRP